MGLTSYETLMKEVYESHKEFKRLWALLPEPVAKQRDTPKIVAARNRFINACDKLWYLRLAPLGARFKKSPAEAVDEIIDFLEVDIPAHRCGYEKEYYLQHLKAVPITERQKVRLQNILLKLCSHDEYRREMRRWGRLMINLADDAFVTSLAGIVENKPWPAHRKAAYILSMILENRKDLNGK
jgi:hypothetical protein